MRRLGSACNAADLVAALKEPSDPLLPLYWSAEWTMYRIFRRYAEVMPPYDGPPPDLIEESDYQVSYGATYYDSA